MPTVKSAPQASKPDVIAPVSLPNPPTRLPPQEASEK